MPDLPEIPTCAYDPDTGELRVKRGGIYQMEFKEGLSEKSWDEAKAFFRKTSIDTQTTFVLHSPGRKRVLLSWDQDLEDLMIETGRLEA